MGPLKCELCLQPKSKATQNYDVLLCLYRRRIMQMKSVLRFIRKCVCVSLRVRFSDRVTHIHGSADEMCVAKNQKQHKTSAFISDLTCTRIMHMQCVLRALCDDFESEVFRKASLVLVCLHAFQGNSSCFPSVLFLHASCP